MRRQKKKFARPRKPFDKVRMDEEDILKEKYGLKSKREIWKADAAIRRIRNLAKKFIVKSDEEQKIFTEKLQMQGFNVKTLANALALNKEDWLKRRLQTVMFHRKLVTTPKQARQFIVHKHVSIGEQIVSIPSYQVSLDEEPLIKLNVVLKTEKPKSKEEEIKEEIFDSEGNMIDADEVEGKVNNVEENVMEVEA